MRFISWGRLQNTEAQALPSEVLIAPVAGGSRLWFISSGVEIRWPCGREVATATGQGVWGGLAQPGGVRKGILRRPPGLAIKDEQTFTREDGRE